MVSVALVVPVMKNFKGLAQLMESVDHPVLPVVINNWDSNTGVSAGWNLGLSIATGYDVAIVSNDDVVFEPGMIARLAGDLTSRYTNVDLITARNLRDHPGEHEGLDLFRADYSCFAVRPYEFVKKFGLFDENFYPAYFEDNDMDYRIRTGGGLSAMSMDATMFHKGSVTQNMDTTPVVDSPTFEENRAYYVKKWGGRPGEETFTRPFNDETKTFKDC